jgi:hypothetical protein
MPRRSKADFFAPRRTRQRDNNDNNEHRQIDDNTNEINVHNSVIDEFHPPPVFTNNYSVFSGQEGSADNIGAADGMMDTVRRSRGVSKLWE